MKMCIRDRGCSFCSQSSDSRENTATLYCTGRDIPYRELALEFDGEDVYKRQGVYARASPVRYPSFCEISRSAAFLSPACIRKASSSLQGLSPATMRCV